MRLAVTLAAVTGVLLLLGISVWDGAPRTWDALELEYERFEPMPRAERERAFVALLPMPVDVFSWYREQLRPGDRYWIHGAPGGYSRTAPLREVVRNVGRLFFVPAIEVDEVEDADVVVSWGADPAELGLDYCHQVRAGAQPYWVSRVDCGD